jgi:hypothetical protein
MIPSTNEINEHIQNAFDSLKKQTPEMYHEMLRLYLRSAFMEGWIRGQGELAREFLEREEKAK